MAACVLISAAATQAADFFSTEKSEKLITIGVRAGFNTSSRTVSDSAFPGFYNQQSWGTGFDAGAVVNLHFRDYISLQPGIFFESRSSRYTLIGSDAASATGVAQAGKVNTYNLTVPVLAVLSFNVTDDIRWNVEAGPYVSFVLDSKHNSTRKLNTTGLFSPDAANVDFGFKLGTGLQVMRHYYIGAHYMAGCIDAWKDLSLAGGLKQSYGGVTKGWVFTLGYDF